MNKPFFDSVPLPSVVVFAALWPTSLAFFVQLLVGRHVDEGRDFSGGQVLWRTVAAGVLASIGTFVLPLPATVATAVSGSTGVGGIVYAVILVILAAVAVTVLVAQWRRLRAGETAAGYSDRLMPGYGAVYLAVMVVLWITALPAYFGAVDGVTANGDPVGSLWYAAACLLLSALAVAAVLTVGQPALSRTTPEPIGSGSR